MPDTPNIVFVHTDQQHHKAFSAYGNKWLKTPHMDRVAKEGYNFMESVSSNPVCCPARTCWYTGRASKETGVLTNSYPLQEHIPDLGQWLRKKTDYDAVYSGKWHVPSRDVRESFDQIHPGIGQGEIGDSDTTRSAIGWMLNRKSDKPFFLSLGLLNPHDCCYLSWPEGGPYKFSYGNALDEELPPLPDNWDRKNAQKSKTMAWSELDWRYYIYNYFRMCEMVDVEIGRIYDAIRRSRFAENTVFIFSSDHGDGTGHHGRISKGYLLEEALRVPLIISWPDRYKSGVRDWDNLVTGLDIPATICELAGAPALPDSTQSKSLVPILEGKAKAPLRTYSVAESSQSGLACAVRDKTYKSILSPQKHELFNLAKDPLETKNLAEDSGHAGVLAQHKTYLKEYVNSIDYMRTPPNMKQLLAADKNGKRYPRGDLYTPANEFYDAAAKGAI